MSENEMSWEMYCWIWKTYPCIMFCSNNEKRLKNAKMCEDILMSSGITMVSYTKDFDNRLINSCTVKPNYKNLVSKYKDLMKYLVPAISKLTIENICELFKSKSFDITCAEKTIKLIPEDIIVTYDLKDSEVSKAYNDCIVRTNFLWDEKGLKNFNELMKFICED